MTKHTDPTKTLDLSDDILLAEIAATDTKQGVSGINLPADPASVPGVESPGFPLDPDIEVIDPSELDRSTSALDSFVQDGVAISPHDIDIDPNDYASNAGEELAYSQQTKWYGSTYERQVDYVQSRGELVLGDGGATYDGGYVRSKYDKHIDFMGNKTTMSTWDAYDKIVGGSGDDVIYGAGRQSVADGHYDHNDVIFGGEGNDRIYGLEGDDTLSGGSGDDRIYGGDGDDEIYGGDGNDIIDGGKGADVLYGGAGNDWIFSGHAESGQGETVMYGGSGSDVFVIGDRSGFDQTNEPFDWSGFVTDTLYTVGGLIPEVGGYINAVRKIIDSIPLATEGSGSSNNWDGSNAAVVKDFNPAEDVLIIPLNRDGTPNAHLKFEGLLAGEAFRVYEDAQSTKLIAVVYWADLSESLGIDMSQLSATELSAFQSSIQNTMLVMDSDQVVNGAGQTIDLGAGALNGLGSDRFMVIGSHSGQVVRGSNQSEYQFGTGNNDVLMGYNYGAGGEATTAGDDVFHGFGGDDLFITGAGTNTVYGGEGSDTAAYYDASSGITVDMTDLTSNSRGDYFVIRAKYRDAEGNVVSSTDRLFDIENIIGTDHADVFKGNAADNTFISGFGDDTMTGGAGADTFILNGGKNKITDYDQTAGDRVIIDMSAYDISARSQVYEQAIGAGNFQLVLHNNPNQVIVEINSLSGNGIAVGLMDENGDVRFYLNHGDNVFHMNETDGYVRGLSGDDIIYGSDASESIYGDSGDDELHGGGGNDYLSGDDGHDTIHGGDGNDFIRGGRGDDTLFGGDGNDIIFSGGSDQIGQWGWDRLYGEEGDDVLVHDGPNKAHLFGGNGDDKLFNLEGNSFMWGGSGDDLLVVSGGFAEVSGGAGKDSFVMDGGKMRITDYDMEDTIFIDYESYGYSSADDILFGWETVRKDGAMEYYDKATGELMLEVHGDWDGFSGPSIKLTTGDWSDWYL